MSDLSLPLAPGAVSVPAVVPEIPAAPGACASCGTPLGGEYCSACGQRVHRERFTLRSVFMRLVTDAFDLNRGLLFTALALFRRPGEAVREYVGGATVRYTNPVKYLVICVALAVFASVQAGITHDIASGMAEGAGAAAQVRAQQVSDLLAQYMNLFMVLAVPFMTLASRLVYRRAGFNFAEHLIFNLYVYAQQSLLYLPFVPFSLGPGKGSGALLAYTLLNGAYYVWAATGFFRDCTARGVLRAAGAALVGTVAYLVVFVLIMTGLMVWMDLVMKPS
ncbi:MAG TPA: DUF3667 domain-containing protein [Longimicrobiaceae bacterium]|nr:DUF3667 domain-containing protein [Longimicrobiaceae bacterium]